MWATGSTAHRLVQVLEVEVVNGTIRWCEVFPSVPTFSQLVEACRMAFEMEEPPDDVRGAIEAAFLQPPCKNSTVSTYASAGYYEEGKGIAEIETEFSQLRAKDYIGYKLKVGRVGLSEDFERMRAVRRVIGSDRMLMIDGNEAYDSAAACHLGQMAEGLGIFWFEEPTSRNDAEAISTIAAGQGIALAYGEQANSPIWFKDRRLSASIGVFQANLTRLGPRGFLSVAELARDSGKVFAAHSWSSPWHRMNSEKAMSEFEFDTAPWVEVDCSPNPIRDAMEGVEPDRWYEVLAPYLLHREEIR